MNMAFVKLALKCDFLCTGVNRCYIDSASKWLDLSFGKATDDAKIQDLEMYK